MPPASQDSGNSRERLAAHVEFLSQPALKGRTPGTTGSRLAREYIEDRFKAYGLVPWQQAKSYELPFGFGCNVAGVLPGTNTNLAHEFVLLSAHYDHLGKKKGKIYPGAADNASGIAALLEIARQLSQSPHRPKRSIAFVAFDCKEDMLLGSMAFTCREDVRKAKIAAVVNVDMLGRDFMDVVSNTLFIAGTEGYPALCKQVRQSGAQSGLRVLPIGTDLIGPRGDHASFESLGMRCVGNREQVTDYCLLLLRDCKTNHVESKALGKLYRAASGITATNDYRKLLAERLARGRFETETEWITNCILSQAPMLADLALASAGDCPIGPVYDAASAVLADPSRRPDVRIAAIECLAKQRSKSGLLAICDALNDTTSYRASDYDPLRSPDCPLSSLAIIKTLQPLVEKQHADDNAPKTIDAVAREQLKKATRKDFGNDAARWRHWIRTHL